MGSGELSPFRPRGWGRHRGLFCALCLGTTHTPGVHSPGRSLGPSCPQVLSPPWWAAPSSPDSLGCSLSPATPCRAPQSGLPPLPAARPWGLGSDMAPGGGVRGSPPCDLNLSPYDQVSSGLSRHPGHLLEKGRGSGPAALPGGVFWGLRGGWSPRLPSLLWDGHVHLQP